MLDVKRIRNDFDALAEKLATRGVVAETLNELKELEFIPFQNAINSGADAIMVSHILLKNIDSENI